MDIKTLERMSAKPTVDIAQLPDKFDGVLVAETTETDSYNTECLFWEIDLNGNTFKQKYSPSQIYTLMERLTELGIDDTQALIGKRITFVKKAPTKKNTKEFPRWYPSVVQKVL